MAGRSWGNRNSSPSRTSQEQAQACFAGCQLGIICAVESRSPEVPVGSTRASRVAHTCRILACMRSQHSVHREYGSITQKVVSPTGPRPVSGFFNQLASDRIGVHVVEFFLPLLGAPDVHVIAPALPDPEVSVMVNGGRQLNATEHLLAPGIARIIFQILQNK